MSNKPQAEIIMDDNKVLFMGPCATGKTRKMLSMVMQQYAPIKDMPIYAVDPHRDIATAAKANLDAHHQWQLDRIQYVSSVSELPKNMQGMILMMDDGRGYFSLIEKDHFKNQSDEPRRLFATIQIVRSMDTL